MIFNLFRKSRTKIACCIYFLLPIAGTLNSDQPRDLQLPLKQRFYLQPLPPSEAAARAKESAKDILNVKQLIDKKEWPYVMNDLRLKAGYLRFDLNTIISAKPKEEKKTLKELTGKLFAAIDEVSASAFMIMSIHDIKSYLNCPHFNLSTA